MKAIRYMSIITAVSVLVLLVSIVSHTLDALRQLQKVSTVLDALVALERGHKRTLSASGTTPRVAVGYGACYDLEISGTHFLNYTEQRNTQPLNYTVEEVNNYQELLQTFGYYFARGAATERIMPNKTLFKQLIRNAKTNHRNAIKWSIGGNAPLMGLRFFKEGTKVLLGARMSKTLRNLLPPDIAVAGEPIDEDDIHLILEYKSRDIWGPFTAPRANRYILHNDQHNPHLNALDDFQSALRNFQPNLVVISGLQMMDSYSFSPGLREARLLKLKQQLRAQHSDTLHHFEMASYVDTELIKLLMENVLPYVDSLGMNEQELVNLRMMLEHDRPNLVSDCNPRVATTLDHMRMVFKLLSVDYHRHMDAAHVRRPITRIHLHTLAFQAIITTKKSPWHDTQAAIVKASLTALRYVCQNDGQIDPGSASLLLDDSFATTAGGNARRIYIDFRNPINCWDEKFSISNGKTNDMEICVAPVLVCRVAKKTAGAGDNISAAALALQI